MSRYAISQRFNSTIVEPVKGEKGHVVETGEVVDETDDVVNEFEGSEIVEEVRASVEVLVESKVGGAGEAKGEADAGEAEVEADTEARADADAQAAPVSHDFAPTSQVEDSLMHPKVKAAFMKIIGSTLTAVQQKSMNDFIESKAGIVVRAKTGTGKTYAFGIPVMHDMVIHSYSKKNMNVNHFVNTVIFSPTRDLATQTSESLSKVWKLVSPRTYKNDIALIMGQMPKSINLRSFHKSDRIPRIVVATPGRFIDLFENESSFRNSMKHLKNIIIDEADELLNSNFKEDMTDIISGLQKVREPIPDAKDDIGRAKTMLFSATMDSDVFDLAKTAIGEHFPFIDITDHGSEVNENISQSLEITDKIFESYAAAAKFIEDNKEDPNFKAIIFVSTTAGVDLAYRLIKDSVDNTIPIFQLHGKLAQGRRNSQQKGFRFRKNAVLVASNVAARGMDFPNVSHVLQIGISPEASSHTHRIGRTGRAGKKGQALLIVTKSELPYVDTLKKQGNKFTVEKEYEQDEEFESKLQNFTKEYEDLEQIIHSCLSSYASVPQEVARVKKDRIARDCSEFYQSLIADETKKPYMSYRTASKIGMDTRILMKFFEVPRQRDNRGGNRDGDSDKGGYRGGNSGGYRGGNSGGYRGGDRGGYKGGNSGGYRGGDRGGNSGGYRGGDRGGDRGGYRGGSSGGYKGGNTGGYRSENRGGYKGDSSSSSHRYNNKRSDYSDKKFSEDAPEYTSDRTGNRDFKSNSDHSFDKTNDSPKKDDWMTRTSKYRSED
ncbi:hypothetical protein FOA43_002394 [Brettanomyces nanus]|uniref:ATP-dependent RNA helicase n=1 Tax=Eeniella nana TaxID=13502 RepID=A0A875S7A2_EENNA|nr:uncharacterized protein FOA43_002394 [Brettanomyces nanus]QPG75054.1 hypothetical protein FOA43_002394 [Brettanomyces nanus]